MTIRGLQTPALLVDEARFDQNVGRMNASLDRLGVPLRPHLKTVKNVELARRMLAGHPGGATVSTLAEADHFFAAGIDDLLYAVGIAPGKLDAAARRIRNGMKLGITLFQGRQVDQILQRGSRSWGPAVGQGRLTRS